MRTTTQGDGLARTHPFPDRWAPLFPRPHTTTTLRICTYHLPFFPLPPRDMLCPFPLPGRISVVWGGGGEKRWLRDIFLRAPFRMGGRKKCISRDLCGEISPHKTAGGKVHGAHRKSPSERLCARLFMERGKGCGCSDAYLVGTSPRAQLAPLPRCTYRVIAYPSGEGEERRGGPGKLCSLSSPPPEHSFQA